MQLKDRISVSLIALVTGALAFGCSSDSTNKNKSPSTKDGGGKDGGQTGSSDAGTCNVTLAPSANDLTTIQSALDSKVKTGNTVCFSPGTYHLTNHIALSGAAQVTFRGTGATRDATILDFTGQTNGDEGVLVTTDGFTIENLSIKNTKGNGIKVQAANSLFHNIKVGWDRSIGTPDAGPLSGAYAIYPTGCDHTIMDHNEVYGAADAGIYAGQCKHVVAHDNESHNNVLGIEVENTIGADVYDNDVHDNATGFLLDLLPDLQQKISEDYHFHGNHVHDNNGPNFGQKNTLAATAPSGTGMLVLAATKVEITGNTIENNGGVGVLIVSYDIIDLLAVYNGGQASTPDKTTPRWPREIYVHDNTFAHNGGDPQGPYGLLTTATDGGKKVIPYNVLWDGILNPNGYGDAGIKSDAAAQICLGATEQQSFVDFHGDTSLGKPAGYTTDVSAHKCTLDIPPLSP